MLNPSNIEFAIVLLLSHLVLAHGFCPVGMYLDTGKCSLCKGGYFGSDPGLTNSNCSGKCSKGYFCPEGSASPEQYPCGGFNYYCPDGSATSIVASTGYYTVASKLLEAQGIEDAVIAESHHNYEQKLCEPGFYCKRGIRRECPSGTFGDTSGLSNSNCSGVCPRGNFCPSGSSRPSPCPKGTFGNATGLKTNLCSGFCPIGSYCGKGYPIPVPCPAGTFGNSTGLVSRFCSSSCTSKNTCIPSLCPAGYFCPLGAKKPIECTNVSQYCPEGSGEPLNATKGFYTMYDGNSKSSNNNLKSSQKICDYGHYCINGLKLPCPGGYFGSVKGLFSEFCSQKCPGGYYCPKGSRTYFKFPCGSVNLFCPQGSSVPSNCTKGYYTHGGTTITRSSQKKCESGNFCVDGIKYQCPLGKLGNREGLYTSECAGACPVGFICPIGSTDLTKKICTGGTYTTNGKICLPCSPGYWCNPGSSSPVENRCGSDTLYCPLKSSKPKAVEIGYYSWGGTASTQSSQTKCSPQSESYIAQCPSTTVGDLNKL